MWLENIIKRLSANRGSTVFKAAPSWGAPYVIKALGSEDFPLVWLTLDPEDREDDESLGNKLADALQRATKRQIVGYGLSYRYGLSFLQRYGAALGPFTYAVSNAQLRPEFALELLKVVGKSSRVIFSFETQDELPKELTNSALVLEENDLTLTLAEAKLMTKELPPAKVEQLLNESQGCFEIFLGLLHKQHDHPLPVRPTSQGFWLTPGFEMEASFDELLTALEDKERWLDALKLAVAKRPERIADIVKVARNHFLSRGLHKQIYPLLKNLDPSIQADEHILYLLLGTAYRLGKYGEIRTYLDDFLANNVAPDLRAYHAFIFLPMEQRRSVQADALAYKKTPYTLAAYGFSLGLTDPSQGEQLLRESVQLAEQDGDIHATLRNTWGLAARLNSLGRYKESSHWSEWALNLYQKQALNDTHRWLFIANEWAFSRILIGETAGLKDLLTEATSHLQDVPSGVAKLLRSTLGDYYLSQGELNEALAIYEAGLAASNRETLGAATCAVVRVLTELGRVDEALQSAEKSHHLAKDRGDADLALGMALAFTEPERACDVLERAVAHFSKPLRAIHWVRSSFYLAKTHLNLNDFDTAFGIIEACSRERSELAASGLQLLAGPADEFDKVFSLEQRNRPTLNLSLLGSSEIYLRGKMLRLSKRQIEVLALLVLYPNGLNGEELAYHLLGDNGTKGSVKSLLSRLRKIMPLSDQPYTLELDVEADFLKIPNMILAGRILEAVSSYKGAFFPETSSPRLISEREYLDEILRQAVLDSRHPDALLHLGTFLEDDLELWEVLLDVLSPADPRYPMIAARERQISSQWKL